MYGIQSSTSIATRLSNCDRYRVTIVSERLELDDREMPVPKDCQTIEVWAKLAEEIQKKFIAEGKMQQAVYWTCMISPCNI